MRYLFATAFYIVHFLTSQWFLQERKTVNEILFANSASTSTAQNSVGDASASAPTLQAPIDDAPASAPGPQAPVDSAPTIPLVIFQCYGYDYLQSDIQRKINFPSTTESAPQKLVRRLPTFCRLGRPGGPVPAPEVTHDLQSPRKKTNSTKPLSTSSAHASR